ncbi:MAG: DUF1549 and DUF1553 domain-containing protein [Gemmatales bacterium]|nr:DUF1549 and DUF1553 domain-containing protein [Gemmatales bacterium]MDW8385385.1 DUF1549 and DUF1553 domain-containing protein [Gemmatales bacterium]
MPQRCRYLPGIAVWITAALWLWAGFAEAQTAPDATELARRIDRHIEAAWQAAGVKPADLADDAEFLRRIYLDLAGRIPTVSEVRQFFDDPDPDKRRRVVDRLLASPGYVNHFANVFRSAWLPELDNAAELAFTAQGFDAWIRSRLAENTPYDRLVRELLTVSANSRRPPVAVPPNRMEATPIAFFTSKEAKPENLAAATARMFLGIRLECAQCHNHPTAQWKQEQFWSYAAFFAGLQTSGPVGELRELPGRRELVIPNTQLLVGPVFLDGRQPEENGRASTRQLLADWITARDNPFFAKATVNRFWEQFFGIGLVDPVDDMEPDNPPSHPELLGELATAFAASGFDLKFLIRAIVLSQTYQRSSVQTDTSQDDPRLFARMALKGLTPEQIVDSLFVAVGAQAEREPQNVITARFGDRNELLARFRGSSARRIETQTSILQALALMNGRFISEATDLEKSRTLAAVVDAPFLDNREKVETLFLAALSRKPTAEESKRFVEYVQSGGASGDSAKALADVFWVLLNSGEFLLNH